MDKLAQEKELFKWVAASRPYRPQSKQFFSTAIVIAVLISAILVLAGEWMLIMVMAALIFVYYVWSMMPPEQIQYTLTTKGIKVNDQLYRWEDCARWWLTDKWGSQLLVVDTPFIFPKRLHLVVDEKDVKSIEEVMYKFLEMERPLDTGVDKVSKWLTEKFPLEAK